MSFKKFFTEAEVQKRIVVFGGRFQPFHKGHKATYDGLVAKFGKDSVYIAPTLAPKKGSESDPKTDPFTSDEKVEIITTLYPDIPKDKIVVVSNPYNAKELVEKKPDSLPLIFAVGAEDLLKRVPKETDRSKILKDADINKPLKPKSEVTYFYGLPKITSATALRKDITDTKGNKDKLKKAFTKWYGEYNPEIAKMFSDKMVAESQIEEDKDMPDFLLMEGGAYGHLAHFHDVRTNTFADLKEFIDTVLQGKMEYARIKTDGMNLMFSFIDGHLRAARNQGDLKGFGKNSLTLDTLNKKFEGRDNIQNAFTAAARDL